LSLCAGVAVAGGKPLPASQSNPPRYLDESSTVFHLGGDADGYGVVAKFAMSGGAKGDRVRMEVKKGGKLLQKDECYLDPYSGGFKGQFNVKCNSTRADKKLTATGPIEVDVIYEDDQSDKEYLLRTFKANVKHWNKPTWQIEADDLLATAFLFPREAQTGEDVVVRFWIAGSTFSGILRCSVDGKVLPDIEAHIPGIESFDADILDGDKRTTWIWTQAELRSTWWKVAPTTAGKPDKGYLYLSEHPGTWACQLRSSGTVVREFKFKADAKGQVESHPMQQAPDAPPLVPRVALIEVKIPKDNGVDKRIKPDQLKKSRLFGLPWPKHDSVKALLANLPPAYENQHPVAAKQPAGKLLIGSEQTPPKVIDESSTIISVYKNGAGYKVSADQVVSGVSQAPGNRYRLEWKQGGKTVATVPCSWTKPRDESATYAHVQCGNQDQVITAKGAVEGHLILTDDNAGVDYLLRVYKVTVAKYPSKGDPVWQIVPDDLLATAWANQEDETLWLSFWVAVENPYLDLRCTVDGKKIPDMKMNPGENSIQAEVYDAKAKATKYIWHQSGSINVALGLPPKDFKPDATSIRYIGEYPGKWDCKVRKDGKELRQLLFTVNNKGRVEADPAQPGVYPDWVVPIDIRFGKDIVDVRVRPDAMKKSRGFGLPWPKPPTKPFPKASGLPDPK
jgi:hypothetical protein